MTGNPLDRILVNNLVSIRAVLVHGDEDPARRPGAAGITDPIAIPVFVGEHIDLSGGLLGARITPKLIAVLETEAQEDFAHSPPDRAERTSAQSDAARPAGRFTTTAPDAFGTRSFAPTSRLGDTPSGRLVN